MYLEHWSLERPPFEAQPDSRFLFPTPQHEQARAVITYAACEGGEPVLLRGMAGCGKTILLRALRRQLPVELYRVVFVPGGRLLPGRTAETRRLSPDAHAGPGHRGRHGRAGATGAAERAERPVDRTHAGRLADRRRSRHARRAALAPESRPGGPRAGHAPQRPRCPAGNVLAGVARAAPAHDRGARAAQPASRFRRTSNTGSALPPQKRCQEPFSCLRRQS